MHVCHLHDIKWWENLAGNHLVEMVLSAFWEVVYFYLSCNANVSNTCSHGECYWQEDSLEIYRSITELTT